MSRIADALDTEGGVRFLWWLIGASLVVGFFVFLAVGANGPKDPSVTPRQSVSGFGTVAFAIEHGSATDSWCALLAATQQQQETGMMGRHDLGGLDAMVFSFAQPVDNKRIYFYNRRVPIALSVAWFDAGGSFLSTADMDPCADVPDCPRVTATAPYKFAVEVPKGGLPRLGIGAGSRILLGKSDC